LQEGLGVLHQVSVEDVRALLLSQIEALIPLAVGAEHLETRHVATLNELGVLASGDQLCFLGLLDLVDIHMLHLHRSQLLSTFESSVPFLALHISLDSFIEESAVLINISSRIELLDIQKSWTKSQSDILDSILGIVHG
jgi:hypothetical protein